MTIARVVVRVEREKEREAHTKWRIQGSSHHPFFSFLSLPFLFDFFFFSFFRGQTQRRVRNPILLILPLFILILLSPFAFPVLARSSRRGMDSELCEEGGNDFVGRALIFYCTVFII